MAASSKDSRILDYLSSQRSQISAYIDEWMSAQHVHFGGMEAILDRIRTFTLGGKMIRGSLVLLGQQLYDAQSSWDHSSLGAAGAMELVQSFLLIHDDIMDRDILRRGMPSVHMQFAQDALNQEPSLGSADSLRIGEALGICTGDIGSFLANQILLSSVSDPGLCLQLVRILNSELVQVGQGQLMDVQWSFRSDFPTPEEILRIYVMKTGRYTFSLPLLLGSTISGAPEAELSRLGRIGELLGILFQIRDDEIGLRGDPRLTGKPLGSDIREGKKTIFAAELFSSPRADSSLQEAFGSADDAAVQMILSAMESDGVFERVRKRSMQVESAAREEIHSLSAVDKVHRESLQELVRYCSTRDA